MAEAINAESILPSRTVHVRINYAISESLIQRLHDQYNQDARDCSSMLGILNQQLSLVSEFEDPPDDKDLRKVYLLNRAAVLEYVKNHSDDDTTQRKYFHNEEPDHHQGLPTTFLENDVPLHRLIPLVERIAGEPARPEEGLFQSFAKIKMNPNDAEQRLLAQLGGTSTKAAERWFAWNMDRNKHLTVKRADCLPR